MKKTYAVVCGLLFFLMGTGLANASLTVIGTAAYNGESYNLIWDNDNNGKSLVWLDYTQSTTKWSRIVDWAEGLGEDLTVTLNEGFTSTIDWTTGWRLPAVVDGESVYGYDGTTSAGYNITTSEFGHLYYEELGNAGLYDTEGNQNSPVMLENTGPFENLEARAYWSGTETAYKSRYAWHFRMQHGYQGIIGNYNPIGAGIAVISGDVSAVPVPGAIWLLGSGITGLAFLRKGKKSRA